MLLATGEKYRPSFLDRDRGGMTGPVPHLTRSFTLPSESVWEAETIFHMTLPGIAPHRR